MLESSWLLARLCESEYQGWENLLYVQEYRVQGSMSVWEFQGWENQGRGDCQTLGRRPCGWGRRRERDGDSSAKATAALRCYGSSVSSHWTPFPRAPAGWHSPPKVAYDGYHTLTHSDAHISSLNLVLYDFLIRGNFSLQSCQFNLS